MRLASATISSERLFSRLEGLSAIARVEPGAKIAALQPFPTGLTSMRCPLYSIAVIAYLDSLHFNLKRAHASAGRFDRWRGDRLQRRRPCCFSNSSATTVAEMPLRS